MSAEQTPDIAAVLAEHVLRDNDPACSCGWDWDWREVILPSAVDFDPSRYRLPADVRPEQHRAHVAAALAPVLAVAVREAEQRADEFRAEGLGVAAALLRQVVDYWDGRPTEHHGHHIEADLRDVLRAIESDRDYLRRADRITEPVSHEAATSGEEASKA